MTEMEKLREQCLACTRCHLCETRTNVVFGVGPEDAKIMFIGEGPGENEDLQGEPFVGRAGKLLDDMLELIDLDRHKNVYIANIVKCRPPNNRVPEIEEVLSCQRWLEAQIALLQPQIIVCLGNTPLKWFLHGTEGITKMRGRWFTWRGAALMPMFHPSYLLRNQSRERGGPKDLTWRDIQEIRQRYESLRG